MKHVKMFSATLIMATPIAFHLAQPGRWLIYSYIGAAMTLALFAFFEEYK